MYASTKLRTLHISVNFTREVFLQLSKRLTPCYNYIGVKLTSLFCKMSDTMNKTINPIDEI